MAQKQRFLDVWILETNVVYREVPFAVVADWIQQGRLLEDDMLRPSGTKDWQRLGGMHEFAPYLPKEEPLRPRDQAEALEPVEVGFSWKRRHDEEDDDPDMIPLIDVSLVLLIFFMMTTTSVALAVTIRTPAAYYGLKTSSPDMLWIGIDSDDSRTPIAWSLGLGDKPADATYPVPDEERAGRAMKVPPRFLDLLDERLGKMEGAVEVVIKTDERLKDGYYMDLLVELQKRGARVKKYDGVREKTLP